MADAVTEAIEEIIAINSEAPFPPDGGEFNPALLKSQFQLIADNYNNNLNTFVNNLNSTQNNVACSKPKFVLYLILPNNLKDVDIDDIPEDFVFTYPDRLVTSTAISSTIEVKLTGGRGEYSYEPITSDQVKRAVKSMLEKATAGDKNPAADKYVVLVHKGQLEFGITNIFKATVGSRPYTYDQLPACKIVPCVPDPQPFVDAFANPEGE